MAQHTNWDKWMSENLRYALENNKNGKTHIQNIISIITKIMVTLI